MKLLFKTIKGIITFFLLVILLVVVLQKFTNNKIALGNIYIFQVATGSMEPVYKVGDIIVVSKTNPKDLKIGDDVTYHGSENEFAGLTITHRIINTRYENGKYYFITKGVANTGEDPEISEDNVYGKVIYHTVLFSFVGRLMTNIILYYALFILVGVSFSYEIISTYFIKDDDDDEKEE